MTRPNEMFLPVLLLLGLMGCGSYQQSYSQPPAKGSSNSHINVSPASVPVGSSDLILEITGSSFKTGSVQSRPIWSANGTETVLQFTLVSSGEIDAVVPASLTGIPAKVQIWIEDFDEAGQTVGSKSVAIDFSVVAPSAGNPAILAISPGTAQSGSSDLTMTITGVNFACSLAQCHDAVDWSANGVDTSLTIIDSITDGQLVVMVPASLLSSPATVDLEVQFWHKADDVPSVVSNKVKFVVTGSPWDY